MSVRVRPNDCCLYCDTKLKQKPTKHRAYFTCGSTCYRRLSRSLNYFNPEINRRRGQSIFGLSMIWWVLRNAETPLMHSALHSRIRFNFGDLTPFHNKLTSTAIKYFNEDYYTIDRDKDGKMLFTCEDVPFCEALRSKYHAVIEKII